MSQPRIIAGTAKNRKLQVAPSSRPLTDRIKQSLFDTIANWIPEADVLDLFAGSGSFGLEALSRGASSATFVEEDYTANKLLKENIAKLGFEEQSTVSDKQAHKYVFQTDKQFDVIFADPPFAAAADFAPRIVAQCLKPTGIFILRLPLNVKVEELLQETLEHILTETFGESQVTYWRLGSTQKIAT